MEFLNRCVPQKMSKNAIAVILLLMGLGLVILGFTVIPIFGWILAVPVLILSGYFFKVHLNEQCEIGH